MEGLRYERAIAEALPGWTHGQWFEYEDRKGLGWCQVDLLQSRPHSASLLEVKLSWVPEGQQQLEQYQEVVECALGVPFVYGALVCRYLRPATNAPVVDSLLRALPFMVGGKPVVWHCIHPLLVREAA